MSESACLVPDCSKAIQYETRAPCRALSLLGIARTQRVLLTSADYHHSYAGKKIPWSLPEHAFIVLVTLL